MPGCSTCGFAVEWLRSCYSSSKRLFRDQPTKLAFGRYYFNDKAPHYGGLHYFGSNNWQRGEMDDDPPLGEPIDASRKWYNGRAPERLPLPKIIGSPSCLADGETFPVAPPAPVLIDGIDSRCFLSPAAEIFNALCALDAPAAQAAYARMVELVYQEDFATLGNALNLLTGETPVTMNAGSGPIIPAWQFARFPSGPQLLLISGTTSYQQFALQAFTSLIGPANYGAYGTLFTWNNTASSVFELLKAFLADPDKPLLIVGHSYGAAVASLMAARMRLANPTREICLLTFGCPKPGDTRLVDVLQSVRHLTLATDGDLICTLPPNALELFPFSILLPPGLAALWSAFVRYPSYLQIAADGSTITGAPPFMDYPLLLPLLAAVLAGDPIAPINVHDILEYRKRLKVRQPTPAWPINAATWNVLFP